MNMLINICHISVSWWDKKFQVLFDWKAKPWLRAYKTLMHGTKIKIFLWNSHRNRLTFFHENQMRKNESTHINQETLNCKEIPYLCKLKQRSVHKGRPIFGYMYLPTFVDYSITIYHLICPMFLDIPNYPKIGWPLWTLPNSMRI